MTCYTCTSSPEPIPVVQNITYVDVAEATVFPVLTYTPSLSTIAGTLTIQATSSEGGSIAGRFNVVVWFEDGDDFSGITTYNPPTTPGSQTFETMSDETGLATVPIQYSGSVKTWYAYARIGGTICTVPVTMQLGT